MFPPLNKVCNKISRYSTADNTSRRYARDGRSCQSDFREGYFNLYVDLLMFSFVMSTVYFRGFTERDARRASPATWLAYVKSRLFSKDIFVNYVLTYVMISRFR